MQPNVISYPAHVVALTTEDTTALIALLALLIISIIVSLFIMAQRNRDYRQNIFRE